MLGCFEASERGDAVDHGQSNAPDAGKFKFCLGGDAVMIEYDGVRGRATLPHLPRQAVTVVGDAAKRLIGQSVKHVQKRILHPVIKWMAATLNGLVDPGGAVFETKFMLPWTFSEEGAAEKHMAQRQHNTWVADARSAVLSIIIGGGKWVEMTIHADPLYQHLLLTAEKKFWRCVMSGEEPRLFGVEPPRPRLEAIRIVDMSASNSLAEFAATYRRTRPAYQEHAAAKADLKKLVPEDAKEAAGHGLRAKRSKSGAISFDLVDAEAADASLQ